MLFAFLVFSVMFGVGLLCPTPTWAYQNSIVVRVGEYPVTSYDLSRYQAFQKMASRKKVSREQALLDFITGYTIISLVEASTTNSLDHTVDTAMALATNTPVSSDSGTRLRSQLALKYPAIMRFMLKRGQATRAVLSFFPSVKDRVDKYVTSSAIQKEYRKRKKQLIQYPSVQALVAAVELPSEAGFERAQYYESTMKSVAQMLNKGAGWRDVQRKYPLPFLYFSGLTDYKPLNELAQLGYPRVVLGFFDQRSIPTQKGVMKMRLGQAYFVPLLVPLSKTRSVYLVLQIRKWAPGRQLSLKEATPYLRRLLESESMGDAVQDLVFQLLGMNRVLFEPVDASYNAFFKKYGLQYVR